MTAPLDVSPADIALGPTAASMSGQAVEGRSLGKIAWAMLVPGLAIFITVVAFNLFGDGLRDALDPKSR